MAWTGWPWSPDFTTDLRQWSLSSSESSASSSWILNFAVCSPHVQLIVFIVINALQVIAADLLHTVARYFLFFQSPSASVSELCSSPLLSSLSSAAVAAKTVENLQRIFVRWFIYVNLFAHSCADYVPLYCWHFAEEQSWLWVGIKW